MKRTIICVDCGKDFDFSDEDQALFARLRFPDPIRCRPCRDAAKRQRALRRAGREEERSPNAPKP